MGKSKILIKFKINRTKKQKSDQEINQQKFRVILVGGELVDSKSPWKRSQRNNSRIAVSKYLKPTKYKSAKTLQIIFLSGEFGKGESSLLQSNNYAAFHSNESLLKLLHHYEPLFFLPMILFLISFFLKFITNILWIIKS